MQKIRVINRRAQIPELCEIRSGGYTDYHYVCGLDTLGDLVIYARNREEFLTKEMGIEKVPSSATSARILSMVDGKQIRETIIDVLHSWFGATGEVVTVDGKAICSTTKLENPDSVLQILSIFVTSSGIILTQEPIHEKTTEIPVFRKYSHI